MSHRIADALLVLPLILLATGAHARDWQVDAAKSSLAFKCSYAGEGFDGKFGKFTAQITYDEADLASAKFDVSVDLASADTQNSDRDEALAGADFFDSAKSPPAHFVTQAFAKAADGGVEAKGTLTIRGKSSPVTLKVHFATSGNGATLDVDTTLKRLDFGLGVSSDWNDIGKDVPVHGHLLLTAK
jgi:polyisoprenoid-binding protein YceI